MGSCPMCGIAASRPSWMGSTVFAGRRFEYVECEGCGSLHCDPMPDADVLAIMYGPAYLDDAYAIGAEPGSSDLERLRAWLRRAPTGRFLDYGCGRGAALAVARDLGWEAIGLEFDRDVAAGVARSTGVRVISDLAELDGGVDVLHLGDVLEHLTSMGVQLPAILRAIRPGGLLLAQGPLENQDSVFVHALRTSRRLRGSPASAHPPHHVSLATLVGQRALFQRHGVREIELHVTEVAWPAPRRLSRADLARPRSVALFALRKVSQAISSLHPAGWGNRYFFAGTVDEHR